MGAVRAGVEENLEKAGWTDSAWRRYRKTWLETGDLSALTAMDACDPAAMSGDDWLDCDEYDAKRTSALDPPRPSSVHWDWSVGQTVALLAFGALLAVLIAMTWGPLARERQDGVPRMRRLLVKRADQGQ
jgi:hypothetical protein